VSQLLEGNRPIDLRPGKTEEREGLGEMELGPDQYSREALPHMKKFQEPRKERKFMPNSQKALNFLGTRRIFISYNFTAGVGRGIYSQHHAINNQGKNCEGAL